MTILASVRDRSIADANIGIYFIWLMTVATCYVLVSAHKPILGVTVVVKLQLTPVGKVVTNRTLLYRSRRRELAAVGIAVTGRTTVVRHLEHAVSRTIIGCCRLVAGYTRLSQMSTGEGKLGPGVIGQRKQRGRKAVFIVAAGTKAAVPVRELTPVDIDMAIGTEIVRDHSGHNPALMALLTLESGVQADQREVGLAVVEIRHRHVVPSGGLVTARTVQSEFALMLVLVTGRTVFKPKVDILAIAGGYGRGCIGLQRMTFGAIDLPVLTAQDKTGAVVAEERHRFEMIVVMALEAVRAKLTAMLIHMAAQAGRVQSEICSREVFIGVGRHRRLANQGWIVTVTAL